MLTDDYELVQQGLASRLVQLEELRLEHIGEPNPPLVCATCYALQEECYCVMPVMWQLSTVIYKLRAEIHAPIEGDWRADGT